MAWANSIVPAGHILRLGVIVLLLIVVITVHLGLWTLAQANIILIFTVWGSYDGITTLSLLKFLRFSTIHEWRYLSTFIDNLHAGLDLANSSVRDHGCGVHDVNASLINNRRLIILARKYIRH